MNYDLASIRQQIIGHDLVYDTPFGQRHMFYADFTASGRALEFIEDKLKNIQRSYANTHTEDDYSGKYMTRLLHEAEEKIKKQVNAGQSGKLIATGSGATGALNKLLEIIGVYIPPVMRERIYRGIKTSGEDSSLIEACLEREKPIVFIGPYEHHTNELMWREAFVDVEVIGFNENGQLDLKDLEEKISRPEYRSRQKIVSISAGSNITGLRTPVYDVARIGHSRDAWVFFDFAAVAPYVEINMNRDDSAYFDAIFFSPHKFLGGPGASGILIFNERIYRRDLPPTTAGGGTVVYVGIDGHDFSEDIEAREKAGTPPILQTIKAALAMDLKDKIGIERIEDLEHEYTEYFVNQLRAVDQIELIGNADPRECLSILSFNIRHKDRYLHPKFVTKLLSDLFGIQSRAGCSCAGPYGHVLLGIDKAKSQKLQRIIRQGYNGIKPGWVRINLHYTFTRDDLEYLLSAIRFLAERGHHFLKLYEFDIYTSEWQHRSFAPAPVPMNLDNDFRPDTIDPSRIPAIRASYLDNACEVAASLESRGNGRIPEKPLGKDTLDLMYFYTT
jgi:selenocysteine lyase/cysteine desulfurase